MGEKDATERTLESYAEIFADIMNVLMFNGEEIVRAEDLEDASPVSMYKADGGVHQQERDVAKYWKKMKLRLALVGFENQTGYDPDLPLRGFGYDGAGYRAQLLDDTKEDEEGTERHRYPVLTLVLYFGKSRWTKNRTLGEVIEFPEGLKERIMPFFNDYRLNLFEIAYLTEEQIKKFKSDFRVVAEYFVKSRTNPDYLPEPVEVKHMDAVLNLLAVMTGDNRFEDILNLTDGEERPKTMSEWIDRAIQRGWNEGVVAGEQRARNSMSEWIDRAVSRGWNAGRAEGWNAGRSDGWNAGKTEGQREGRQRTAFNLRKMGMTDDFIAQAVGESVGVIRQWFSSPNPAV